VSVLVRDDGFLLLGEAVAVFLKLAAHGRIGRGDVLILERDQVEEHARALHMAQESVAEALAFRSAFDEAGNVGEGYSRQTGLEVRIERGEGVRAEPWRAHS